MFVTAQQISWLSGTFQTVLNADGCQEASTAEHGSKTFISPPAHSQMRSAGAFCLFYPCLPLFLPSGQIGLALF